MTPGSRRVLSAAEAMASVRGGTQVELFDVLDALVGDREGRARALLEEHGARIDADNDLAPDAPPSDSPAPAVALSTDVRVLMADALERARSVDRSVEVSTEHLLIAILANVPELRARLEGLGLRTDELLARFHQQMEVEAAPIPLSPDIAPLELTTPGEGPDLARILDASANRAREGLRVVEDYVRFALNDPMLTRRLKECRHRLAQATSALDADGQLIGTRDTPGDVGTHIMTPSERSRENPRAVLVANFKRTAEALRSLEEYTKLLDTWLSGRFEILRYDIYTLEKLVLLAVGARWTLHNTRLYLLAGGLPTLEELSWVVGEALAGGVDAVQLREKDLPDRELLRRARELRLLTMKAHARFFVNDRPDLARLAGADGVHLGQDDLSVRDGRRIMGSTALIGVSTHEPAQLERAVLDGASYLGVGPVFPSETKAFGEFAGLAFVESAASLTERPWFAIGGISAENVDTVLEAGARRVAVGASILRAPQPRKAAAELRARLDAAPLAD